MQQVFVLEYVTQENRMSIMYIFLIVIACYVTVCEISLPLGCFNRNR